MQSLEDNRVISRRALWAFALVLALLAAALPKTQSSAKRGVKSSSDALNNPMGAALGRRPELAALYRFGPSHSRGRWRWARSRPFFGSSAQFYFRGMLLILAATTRRRGPSAQSLAL